MSVDPRVFVSWTDHGRSRDLSEALGLENYTPTAARKSPLALRYLALSWRTWRLLRDRRPDVVFFMQPPAPLLLTAALYAWIGGSVSLYADLHSGYFNDRKWSWFTNLGLRLLRRHHVIVTNEALAEAVADRVENVHVLHDVLRADARGGDGEGGFVLCPLSYAADEPLDALLDAAASTPDVQWKLTGRAPQALRDRATANVHFTGFVSNREYDALLHEAAVVMALTSRADTMQRAGYEALCTHTPLVISRQDVLRGFFGDAAVYADHTADSLIAAVRDALTEPALPSRLSDLLTRRVDEQQASLTRVRTSFEGGR